MVLLSIPLRKPGVHSELDNLAGASLLALLALRIKRRSRNERQNGRGPSRPVRLGRRERRAEKKLGRDTKSMAKVCSLTPSEPLIGATIFVCHIFVGLCVRSPATRARERRAGPENSLSLSRNNSFCEKKILCATPYTSATWLGYPEWKTN